MKIYENKLEKIIDTKTETIFNELKEVKHLLSENLRKIEEIILKNETFNKRKDKYEAIKSSQNNLSDFQEIQSIIAQGSSSDYDIQKLFDIKKYYQVKHIFPWKKSQGINIKNPKTFEDKVTWIRMFDNIPLKTKLANKLLLCEYAKELLGKDICVPKLKIYNKISEFKLSDLPAQFVLKTNQGSGYSFLEIIRNKKTRNPKKIMKKFKKAILVDYGEIGPEPHYHGINVKFYAEKYIGDPSKDVDDYKLYCFHGKVVFFSIISKRFSSKVNVNYYDGETKEFLELHYLNDKHNPKIKDTISPTYETMKKYAEKLSAKFIFVRVDFFSVKDEIYLGEMTFSHHGGKGKWISKKYEQKICDLLDLDTKPNISDYNPNNLIKLNYTDIPLPITNFI